MSAPPVRAAPVQRNPSPWLLVVLGILALVVLVLDLQLALDSDTPWLHGLAVLPTLLVVGLAWHRYGRELLGPLFFYDLLRLARRGRTTLLRGTYAVAVLAGFYLAYTSAFPRHDLFADPFAPGPRVTPTQRARVAANFVATVLLLQQVAVVLLTPAYLANAIAEEKERRTLELLFTTHLVDREIVLGKLYSRLAHLGGLLLAGLPILSMMQIFGGVEPDMLLAGFIATAVTLASIGSVSILFSVLCRNVLTAVLCSYTVVAVVTLGCAVMPVGYTLSPLAFALELEQQMDTHVLGHLLYGAYWEPSSLGAVGGMPVPHRLTDLIAGYATMHVGIAAICAALAVAGLRPFSKPGEPETVAIGVPARPRREEERDPPPRRRVAAPVGSRIPVTDRFLLWKEVYHGAGEPGTWSFWPVYLPILGVGGLLVGLGAMVAYEQVNWVESNQLLTVEQRLGLFVRVGVNPAIRGVGLGLAACWCVAVALRAAGAISREREQHTLESLLVLPVPPRAILGAKWAGSILRYRQLGYALAAVWTIGLVSGALHPVGVLLLVLACAVHLAFLASLGLWLSLVSRNSLWSNFTMVLMLLLTFLGWWVVLAYSQVLFAVRPGQGNWWTTFAEVGLNPARSWWYLGFSWDDFDREVWSKCNPWHGTFGAAVAGLGIFALAAGLLWLASCERFGRAPTPGKSR